MEAASDKVNNEVKPPCQTSSARGRSQKQKSGSTSTQAIQSNAQASRSTQSTRVNSQPPKKKKKSTSELAAQSNLAHGPGTGSSGRGKSHKQPISTSRQSIQSSQKDQSAPVIEPQNLRKRKPSTSQPNSRPGTSSGNREKPKSLPVTVTKATKRRKAILPTDSEHSGAGESDQESSLAPTAYRLESRKSKPLLPPTPSLSTVDTGSSSIKKNKTLGQDTREKRLERTSTNPPRASRSKSITSASRSRGDSPPGTSQAGSQYPRLVTQADINKSLPERMGTVGNPAKSRQIRSSSQSPCSSLSSSNQKAL